MVSTVKPTSRRKSIGQHKKHSQKQPDAEAKRAALKVQQAQERLRIITNARSKKAVSHTAVLTDVEPVVDKADLSDLKTSVKVLFMGLPEKLKNEALWDGHDGTVSQIRAKMGSQAMDARTIKKVLHDLTTPSCEPTHPPNARGPPRAMSAAENRMAAALLVDGLSRPLATREVNAVRVANGKPPVTHETVMRAAEDYEMRARRRRKQKIGNSDVDSAWAQARLAQCEQLLWQLAISNHHVARERAILLRIEAIAARRTATSAEEILTRAGAQGTLAYAASAEAEAAEADKHEAEMKAVLERVAAPAVTRTLEYTLPEDATAGQQIDITTEDAVVVVTVPMQTPLESGTKISVAYSIAPTAPLGFVLTQVLWLDEHHEKTRLGLVSTTDRVMPVGPDGDFLSTEDGGTYPAWRNETRPKHAGEARGLFGVSKREMPNIPGCFEGRKMVPFDYTGKTVLGVAAFENVSCTSRGRCERPATM